MYRMLIVDDEKIERSGLCGLVRRFGYPFEILQASNGKQAVQLLQREPFDVLITDIRMPLMDGLELAEWARDNAPRTHVVIASAYGDFAYAQKSISAQVRDYLLKPVDLAQFQSMMERMLELCHADEEASVREQELEEYRRMKREQYLWDLLFRDPGKALSEEARQYYQDVFGTHWVTPVLAETHEPFFDTQGDAFQLWLRELWRWPCESLITEENQAVVLIHGVRSPDDAELEKAAEQLVAKMRRLTRRELFITVGAPVRDPERLTPEMEAVQECGGYKFFVDAGTVVFSKDGGLSGANAVNVAEGLTRSLMEDIHYGDFEKAAAQLELLFKTMARSNVLSALYVKNLSAEALRKAAERARPPLSGAECEEMMRTVMDSRSLYSLLDYVTLRLRALGERTGDEERKTAAHRAVDEAISIIRAEYANPGLSMEHIARRVYLSPSYFSAVFKSETGESATHFLARYRLERARELLEKTGSKISDISAKVGFSSSSYFVTVFHGAYGLSPTQYREQHR